MTKEVALLDISLKTCLSTWVGLVLFRLSDFSWEAVETGAATLITFLIDVVLEDVEVPVIDELIVCCLSFNFLLSFVLSFRRNFGVIF